MNIPCKKCDMARHYTFQNGDRYCCKDLATQAKCPKLKKYTDYLENKRLFVKGETIKTIDELLSQTWVMAYGRSKHIKVISNMQFGIVMAWLERGAFCKAIRKDKI